MLWPYDELQSASAGRSTNTDISLASDPASGYSVRSYFCLTPVSISRGRVVLSNAVPILHGTKVNLNTNAIPKLADSKRYGLHKWQFNSGMANGGKKVYCC